MGEHDSCTGTEAAASGYLLSFLLPQVTEKNLGSLLVLAKSSLIFAEEDVSHMGNSSSTAGGLVDHTTHSVSICGPAPRMAWKMLEVFERFLRTSGF